MVAIYHFLGRRLPRHGGHLQDGKGGKCIVKNYQEFAYRQ